MEWKRIQPVRWDHRHETPGNMLRVALQAVLAAALLLPLQRQAAGATGLAGQTAAAMRANIAYFSQVHHLAVAERATQPSAAVHEGVMRAVTVFNHNPQVFGVDGRGSLTFDVEAFSRVLPSRLFTAEDVAFASEVASLLRGERATVIDESQPHVLASWREHRNEASNTWEEWHGWFVDDATYGWMVNTTDRDVTYTLTVSWTEASSYSGGFGVPLEHLSPLRHGADLVEKPQSAALSATPPRREGHASAPDPPQARLHHL